MSGCLHFGVRGERNDQLAEIHERREREGSERGRRGEGGKKYIIARKGRSFSSLSLVVNETCSTSTTDRQQLSRMSGEGGVVRHIVLLRVTCCCNGKRHRVSLVNEREHTH